MPINLIAPSYFDIYLSDLYYKTGNADKAEPVLTMYARNLAQDMTYFTSLTESQFAQVGEEDIYRNVALAHEVVKVLRRHGYWRTFGCRHR